MPAVGQRVVRSPAYQDLLRRTGEPEEMITKEGVVLEHESRYGKDFCYVQWDGMKGSWSVMASRLVVVEGEQ